MRCHICNTVLSTVVVNDEDGSIEPCTDCMREVKECIEGFEPSTKPVTPLEEAIYDVYKFNF